MGKIAAPQVSIRKVPREYDSLMEPVERYRSSRDEGPVLASKSRSLDLEAPGPGEDVLMHILSLQRAEGGFEIDGDLCGRIGVTVAELKKASKKIKGREKTDGFILLSTALVLQLLNKYFADRERTWKSIVEKAKKWFKRELSRTEPRINGVPLEGWVSQFIKTHPFQGES